MKTANYELSKRLHELGAKPDTEHWWVRRMVKRDDNSRVAGIYLMHEDELSLGFDGIRAATTDELLDVMPESITIDDDWQHIFFLDIPYIRGYRAGFQYLTEDGMWAATEHTSESPADALAALLIWLIENQHVTAEQINSRKEQV